METDIPLGQSRIGRYLCEDIMRGKACPHHESMAKRLYEIVMHAQEDEREKNSVAALDRLSNKEQS